ncbi:MAG TPA: hypothetical protein VFI15_07955, partial [Candidatus Limnocylindrales bacterium]|nr:hypothetical protein [Candidatus Limnocylindrales bacterium]
MHHRLQGLVAIRPPAWSGRRPARIGGSRMGGSRGIRAGAFALAALLASAAGLGPGGVQPVAAAWTASINVYVNDGDGVGRVTSEDGGIDCAFGDGRATGDCSESYTYADFVGNVSVSIRYIPATGSYVCDPAHTGCVTSGSDVGFNVDFARGSSNDAVLAPSFRLKTYEVLYESQGPGTISSNGTPCTPPSGIDHCASFKHGSTVSLVATPDAGYPFNGWSSEPCWDKGTTCTFTITAPLGDYLVAGFGQVLVMMRSSGGGQVCATWTSYCDSPGFGVEVLKYTPLTIVAKPNAGWTFASWSGAPCLGQPATCTFTLLDPVDVTATFRQLATSAPTPKPTPKPTQATAPTARPTAAPSGAPRATPGATASTTGTPGPGLPTSPPTTAPSSSADGQSFEPAGSAATGSVPSSLPRATSIDPTPGSGTQAV